MLASLINNNQQQMISRLVIGFCFVSWFSSFLSGTLPAGVWSYEKNSVNLIAPYNQFSSNLGSIAIQISQTPSTAVIHLHNIVYNNDNNITICIVPSADPGRY